MDPKVPLSPELCEDEALTCERNAAQTTDPAKREEWLLMVEEWRVAADTARNGD